MKEKNKIIECKVCAENEERKRDFINRLGRTFGVTIRAIVLLIYACVSLNNLAVMLLLFTVRGSPFFLFSSMINFVMVLIFGYCYFKCFEKDGAE